jgi:N-acetylated-alpha-linked acidic dipeptidase
LTGKIVLAKYGKNFRGVKAMLAEQHGACGLIIFSDPANDGSTLGDVFPKGAWRPEDAVQRGSAQFLQIAPGDPLTPGFPSIPEYASKRGKYSDAKNVAQKIIIQPISYKNAKYLLDSMNGQAAPSEWRGGIDTTYRLTGSTRVYMKVQMENKIKPIYNVITTIKGAIEPDRNVILGNHYDAWIYGGVDPHTATSSLLELSRLFGKLVQENWRPARTIVIANWDAEEFGLIGSTEHCERYAETLVSQTIAYINIDSFTGREYFDIGASPNLAQVAREESKKVKVSANQTAFELWQKTRPGKNVDIPLYSSLGSGSDYTGFLQYLGISSMEINSDGKYGVYHSVFDSYEYVKRIVDPTFEVCKYTAQIWGLIVLRFASDSILPINNIEYVEFVTTKYQEMRKSANTLSLAGKFDPSQMSNLNRYWSYLEADMQAASDAVVDFYTTKPTTDLEKRQFNDKLMRAERAFIDQQGLAGREWYKHLLFAPGLYLGYGGEVLPGIQTAITHGDYYRIIIEIDRVRLAFSRFVDILNQ